MEGDVRIGARAFCDVNRKSGCQKKGRHLGRPLRLLFVILLTLCEFTSFFAAAKRGRQGPEGNRWPVRG